MFDINELLEVLVFSGIGVLVFAVAFFVMVKIAPFSVQKEIEEDQKAMARIDGEIAALQREAAVGAPHQARLDDLTVRKAALAQRIADGAFAVVQRSLRFPFLPCMHARVYRPVSRLPAAAQG